MTAWASTSPRADHSPLADQLFDQWNGHYANTPHDFGDLGVFTGDEIVSLIRRPQPVEERNATLIALLTLEHSGDRFAGLVLLRSFLPIALRMPATIPAIRSMWQHSPADARTAAIGVLWETLHTYPMHLTSSVAGNIRLTVLSKLTRTYGDARHTIHGIPVDDDVLEQLAGPDDREDVVRQLVTVLTWAVDTGTLTRDEVQLLVRIELADDDDTEVRHTTAAELGITRDSLTRRVNRIRHKLMQAVVDDVEPTIAYTLAHH